MEPEPVGAEGGGAIDAAATPERIDPMLHRHFVEPLLQQLATGVDQARRGLRRRPLIGLQGPVGAGKSTLGRQLEALAPRYGLTLVVASIDDLYSTWPERRRRLAGNPFGVSRVPPGSHDIPLLLAALARWRAGEALVLPRFDKRLAEGQGDRCGWRRQACDAVLLEGWLLGCRPVPAAPLQRWLAQEAGPDRSRQDATAAAGPLAAGRAEPAGPGAAVRPATALVPGGGAPRLRPAEAAWLPHWNRELQAYLPLWEELDGLWILRPQHWGLPRRWRFQAEARQRRRGGGWLTAAALQALVRSSLCSLPPALYFDPLLPATLTCRWQKPPRPAGHSAAAVVGEAVAPDGSGAAVATWFSTATTTADSDRGEGEGTGIAASGVAAAAPDPAAAAAVAGDERVAAADAPQAAAVARRSSATPAAGRGGRQGDGVMAPSAVGSAAVGGAAPEAVVPVQAVLQPVVQAVAVLDGRRRCLLVLTQSSPDSSSSETG
ncbi:MAG: hypothetical protein VKJ44_01395 [Synechococcus sp.]|nr:hypothetical protein [Synechococcus sp.]